MFIYVILCSETLKLYVGQHTGENLGKYLSKKFYDAHRRRCSGERSHLFAAMRKHPRATWSIWPLVSGVQTQVELDELEMHYIKVTKSQHSDIGYNLLRGGKNGAIGNKNHLKAKHKREDVLRANRLSHSPEANKKRSETWARKDWHGNNKGTKFSEERRANISKSLKEKPWSAARRAAQENRSTS